jgi:hypothetical protein
MQLVEYNNEAAFLESEAGEAKRAVVPRSTKPKAYSTNLGSHKLERRVEGRLGL